MIKNTIISLIFLFSTTAFGKQTCYVNFKDFALWKNLGMTDSDYSKNLESLSNAFGRKGYKLSENAKDAVITVEWALITDKLKIFCNSNRNSFLWAWDCFQIKGTLKITDNVTGHSEEVTGYSLGFHNPSIEEAILNSLNEVRDCAEQ